MTPECPEVSAVDIMAGVTLLSLAIFVLTAAFCILRWEMKKK